MRSHRSKPIRVAVEALEARALLSSVVVGMAKGLEVAALLSTTPTRAMVPTDRLSMGGGVIRTEVLHKSRKVVSFEMVYHTHDGFTFDNRWTLHITHSPNAPAKSEFGVNWVSTYFTNHLLSSSFVGNFPVTSFVPPAGANQALLAPTVLTTQSYMPWWLRAGGYATLESYSATPGGGTTYSSVYQTIDGYTFNNEFTLKVHRDHGVRAATSAFTTGDDYLLFTQEIAKRPVIRPAVPTTNTFSFGPGGVIQSESGDAQSFQMVYHSNDGYTFDNSWAVTVSRSPGTAAGSQFSIPQDAAVFNELLVSKVFSQTFNPPGTAQPLSPLTQGVQTSQKLGFITSQVYNASDADNTVSFDLVYTTPDGFTYDNHFTLTTSPGFQFAATSLFSPGDDYLLFAQELSQWTGAPGLP